MAYNKFRLRQKNASGTYDILHIESDSALILRFGVDGTENGTVESALAALESKVANLEGTSGVGSKADKVAGATAGNFAGLDASGNLTDSGSKAADFAEADHDHGFADVTGGTGSRVAVTTSAGVLTTSAITTTKLGYLTDVTSNIQAQINAKAAGDHNHDSVYSPIGHDHDDDYSAVGHNHDTAYAPKTHTHDYAASDHNHDTVYEKLANKGVAGGYAPLGTDGKIAASFLPSYVDDVIEAASKSAFPATGEAGKIYVSTGDNKTYRWSGSAYVEISASLALGETSSTAYAGDKGAQAYSWAETAYTHSQAAHARTDATAVAASSTNGNIKINGTETTVYTHPTTAGNKHIPSGGAANQYLVYSAAGTAKWQAPASAIASGGTGLVTAGLIYTTLQGYALTGHNHDDAYAAAGHNHDSAYAAKTHNHAASEITSGTLGLARGGTGGTTALTARTSLGAANVSFATSAPTSTQNTGDLWFETIS